MPRKTNLRKLNVVNAIIESEIGLSPSPYRRSLRILHSLVKNKSTKFEKIWCEKSNQPIIYEDGKLYFNNHTTCMALCGKDSLPSPIYRLQKNTKVKRFEDVFIYSGPVNCTPLPRDKFKPFFLALTSDNWLIRYDNINGKVLQEIYLGSVQRYSFRHVDWETQGETIALQSTIFPSVTNRAPNAKKLKVVQAMAIFTIMPIKFIGLFEVDQAQFGKEVNTANISEGLLILGIGSSSNGKIRIYSLKDVLKESNRLFEATLDVKCDDLGGKVGQYPFGLPLNYQIKSLPPILFEVKCGEQNLHFGGHPWHYVINPPNTTGIFEVRNVQTNKLAENGRFDYPNNTTEVDTLTFHTDDSGRLVYGTGNSVRFFKFAVEYNGKSFITALQQQYELKLKINDELSNCNGINHINGNTFSREATKNVSYVEKPERTILAEDFENELEFYLILAVNPQTNKRNNGVILIFNNENGKLLHEIKLGISLDEMSDYSLIMDLDTIIITSKQVGGNKYDCIIYRMSRDSDIDVQRALIPEMSEDERETIQRKKRRKKPRKFY